MNAIKLPVQAYPYHNDLWSVKDEEGVRIGCLNMSEDHAKKIALYINCHDSLVKALEFYSISPNAASDAARAALAKVEDLRKNQHPTKP